MIEELNVGDSPSIETTHDVLIFTSDFSLDALIAIHKIGLLIQVLVSMLLPVRSGSPCMQ